MNEINLGGKRDNVTNCDVKSCLDRFATLVTRLDFLDVTPNHLGSHVCHPCHVTKDDRVINNFDNHPLTRKKACFEWLKIVMDEGHLEPSQSQVGRAIGWPSRKIRMQSLWVDFCCWFRKQKIAEENAPEEWLFYELLDKLFIRHEDKYEFPSLEYCREAFTSLRKQYESD